MKISELLTSPPEAFADFVVRAERLTTSDGPPTARYVLACRTCGNGMLNLEEVISGEYGPAGVETTCSGCGEAGTIFHASRDGYDGRLGHLRFLKETTGRQPLCDDDGRPVREAQVACEVSYSIDPEELASTAEEEIVPAQDLFDGFAILMRSSATDTWRRVWDYECA